MATKIITIMSGVRAHAYNSLPELVAGEPKLPLMNASNSVAYFDGDGFELEPKFGANWALTDLVQVGSAKPDQVVVRLHAVLDAAIGRIPADPQCEQDLGRTHDNAVAGVNALRTLTLPQLLSDTSGLLNLVAKPANGPVPHGSWLHRLWYHL